MNEKIMGQLNKYLADLKAANPDADYVVAERALAVLTGQLETLDPPDPLMEAFRKGAGLPDQAPPAGTDFEAAMRRGAGLPEPE